MPAVAAPDRGGPAGAKGACAVTVRETRGRVRGEPVWLRWATQGVPGGGVAEYGAPPRPRPLGRLFRAPRWRRRGAPASVQGGGEAGVGHKRRVRRGGVAGNGAPPAVPCRGGCPARPAAGESPRGAAERRRGGRRGVPPSVQGPKKMGQAGPTGAVGAAVDYRPLPYPLSPPQIEGVPPPTSIP